MTQTYFALGIEITLAEEEMSSAEEAYRFKAMLGHLIGVGKFLNDENVSRTIIAPESFMRRAVTRLGSNFDEMIGTHKNLGEIRHEIPRPFSLIRYGESESTLNAEDFYQMQIKAAEGDPKIVIACLDLEHLLLESGVRSNPDHLAELVKMLKKEGVEIVTYSDLKGI